jgi:hypothetical protein
MMSLPGPTTAYERDLLARAAGHEGLAHPAELTARALQDLAAREGIDFATALLYDRLRRSSPHRDFIRRLETMPDSQPGDFALDATLVVVPGAFHLKFPHTGADGRVVRAEASRFGCRSELVPLRDLDRLAETGRQVCAWLLARPPGPVVLVSLSKGGTDIKAALARPEAADAFRQVAAWVNLCGILEGTPLANWVLARWWRRLLFRLFFWARGYPFAAVHDLPRLPGGPLDYPLPLPEHVRLISVVGFPLIGHLTNRLARRCFRRAQSLGPNDGAGIVLADVCRWPGVVYPVWGADHYLRPAGADTSGLVRRILCWLSEELRPEAAPVVAREAP